LVCGRVRRIGGSVLKVRRIGGSVLKVRRIGGSVLYHIGRWIGRIARRILLYCDCDV
jgi:hypothetical protein